MKRICVIVSIIFMMVAVAGAQETPFQAGLNVTIGFPQNEFSDNVDHNGYGLSGHFGYNIPNSPLTVGANLGFLIYGSKTRKLPLINELVTVDMTTTNSIFQGHLFLRAQAPQGKARPYIDGLFGFNYFDTSTSINDEDDFDEIASSHNFSDGTVSYGGGGGIMIQVYEKPEEQVGRYFNVSVDLGLRYLKGGNARYLKEESITIDENNKVHYDPKESTTDLMNFYFGVSFGF